MSLIRVDWQFVRIYCMQIVIIKFCHYFTDCLDTVWKYELISTIFFIHYSIRCLSIFLIIYNNSLKRVLNYAYSLHSLTTVGVYFSTMCKLLCIGRFTVTTLRQFFSELYAVPGCRSWVWRCSGRSWRSRTQGSFWPVRGWLQHCLCHKALPHQVSHCCCAGIATLF